MSFEPSDHTVQVITRLVKEKYGIEEMCHIVTLPTNIVKKYVNLSILRGLLPASIDKVYGLARPRTSFDMEMARIPYHSM